MGHVTADAAVPTCPKDGQGKTVHLFVLGKARCACGAQESGPTYTGGRSPDEVGALVHELMTGKWTPVDQQ